MLKRYVIGFGVAVAVGAVIYGYGQLQFRAGYESREQQAQLEIAELNELARAKEQVLIAEQAKRDKKQYEEFKDAQDTIAKLRSDVATGRKWLSVAVKQPVCTNEDTTSTSMDNGATRAELDHEAADRIIGIVADGDRAIRQLNALQDWAEAVVEYQYE